MAATPDGLQSGQQILHYRLSEKLGEGGMGVVWKAVDTTLDRSVAIKVLPPAFAADAERLARFEREAKLLASLNHANIATIYSVHVVESVRYLSMELVPGEDLAQRLARGPIPVPEALEIARQIALALEAAHDNGVVHRDLKPANIRLTPDGRVKVLDFGLAKALEADARAATMSQSPTYAVSAMTTGMIIGTAAYMSPEQARGQSADRRADIWAFGVVLYEMLTASRAFDGETVSDTLAAVLRAEPDRALLPKDLPARVRTLIDRCLEKTPRRRLRDIGEALLVLEDVAAGRGAEPEPAAAPLAPVSRASTRLPWAVAALTIAAVAALLLRPGPPAPKLRKLTLTFQHSSGDTRSPVISPDGGQVAYLQGDELWVRNLAELSSRRLANGLDVDLNPVWSPDGEFIAFANSAGLASVRVATGAITPVCAGATYSGGSGGAWSEDGQIFFTRGEDHVYKVPAGGGVATVAIARIDSLEGDLHNPLLLPGRREIVCIIHHLRAGPTTLAIVEPGKRRELLTVTDGLLGSLAYDPRGYLIFSRAGSGAGVWALPFSVASLKATGEPFLIAPDASVPSVSRAGTLCYRVGSTSLESRLVVLNREGVVVDTISRPHPGHWSVTASPDGRFMAVELREGSEGDVWLYDVGRDSESRFAFGSGRQGEPAWSPDGLELLYGDAISATVMIKPADGSRPARALHRGYLAQFTPDGKHYVFSRNGIGGKPDVWHASLDPAGDSIAVLASPAAEQFAMPAPQGGYMAYSSDESGQTEVYLTSLPGAQGRWQVSANGGTKPMWSVRGDRIYYLNGDRLFEVEIQLAPSVRLGTPREVINLSQFGLQTFGRYYATPTPDPDRFVAIRPTTRTLQLATDAVLVENWLAEFAKRK